MPNHWLELDRGHLLHNLAGLRAVVGSVWIMPVVKANHYGAGAVPLAGALAAQGVDAFAVATVPEAVGSREAYPAISARSAIKSCRRPRGAAWRQTLR